MSKASILARAKVAIDGIKFESLKNVPGSHLGKIIDINPIPRYLRIPSGFLNIRKQKKFATLKWYLEVLKWEAEAEERVEESRERDRNRWSFLNAKRKKPKPKKTHPFRKVAEKIDTGNEQLFTNIRSFCFRFKDNEDCLNLLEELFWGKKNEEGIFENIFCPYCENRDNIWEFKKDKYKHEYKCSKCKQQFNVKARTVFAHAKIPLYKILEAIILEMATRGGLNADEFVTLIGTTLKTAWVRIRQIREYGCDQEAFAAIVKDASVFGFNNMPEDDASKPHHGDTTVSDGKEVNRSKGEKCGSDGGAYYMDIFIQAQEEGYASGEVLLNLHKETLLDAYRRHIAAGRIVYTDTAGALKGLSKTHIHQAVNHSKGEYARGRVTSNRAEWFNGELKIESKIHQNNFNRKGKSLFLNSFFLRHNTVFFTLSDRLRIVIKIMSVKLLPMKQSKVIQLSKMEELKIAA